MKKNKSVRDEVKNWTVAVLTASTSHQAECSEWHGSKNRNYHHGSRSYNSQRF